MTHRVLIGVEEDSLVVVVPGAPIRLEREDVGPDRAVEAELRRLG